MKLQGVVLAGGESRRFGSPKAFAKKDGKAFYLYSIQALNSITDSIMLISHPSLRDRFKEEIENIDVFTDNESVQGQGPLSGIYTAMEYRKADWYVTAPVDIPFIQSEVYQSLLQYITEDVQVVVPVIGETVQPLTAFYHFSLKNIIKKQLELEKRAPKQLFNIVNVKFVPMEREELFININKMEDYEKYI